MIAVLLATGCGSLNVPNHPSDLPLRYHNAQYGLTFFLPSNWQGYSVLTQQWNSERYSPAADKTVVADHGPMITLRHPQWEASALYQDIPILVFTRSQWDALHQGKIWPSLYAGGVMDEMWHNRRFVFGISSRYNANDSVKDWKEVADVVERNRAANDATRLYSE